MSEKRTVTVSITINLGNYENLRLEVSDTAETKEDADALRYFLSDILDGYANNNATAKSAIDKYKERILEDAKEEAEEETASSLTLSEDDLTLPFPEMDFSAAEELEEVSVSAPAEPLFAPPEPETVPQTPPAADAEFTCAKCGAPVTKLQRDVSMLFNHKILCKDCMK